MTTRVPFALRSVQRLVAKRAPRRQMMRQGRFLSAASCQEIPDIVRGADHFDPFALSSLQPRLAKRASRRQVKQQGRFLSEASCQQEIPDIALATDHFDTLGMERSFSMNVSELKRNYKMLMSKLHPDLHRSKSNKEQDEIHDQASNVTQAYRTLKNPQHRALHLLDLMGKPLDETATASLLGPDFLMDIMEIREAIDTATDQAEVQRLMGEVNGHLHMTTQQLADAFEHNDLECALKLTAEMQYWNRAQETLREKLDWLRLQ